MLLYFCKYKHIIYRERKGAHSNLKIEYKKNLQILWRFFFG